MARPKRTAASAAQTGAAQTRTAEVKKAAEVKSTAEVKKAAEVKSTAEVKTAEDVKKADEPAVKEAVKETVKPEIEKSVVVEFGGRQVAAKDVLAQAEKAYAKTHPGTVIKSMELYISPEQNAAYYVVNGEGSDDFRIDL
ncbi:DUF6465 family protein [Enterocloster bolteae]|uniref:DUF6465 family protein n=1 Tax=Enterocloster bolteae TaxID=208479 RepID=UPI00322053A5